jgi:hypothetical protein
LNGRKVIRIACDAQGSEETTFCQIGADVIAGQALDAMIEETQHSIPTMNILSSGVSINHCIPKEMAEGMECFKMAAPFGPKHHNQDAAPESQDRKGRAFTTM